MRSCNVTSLQFSFKWKPNFWLMMKKLLMARPNGTLFEDTAVMDANTVTHRLEVGKIFSIKIRATTSMVWPFG